MKAKKGVTGKCCHILYAFPYLYNTERGANMVELDQFKTIMNSYEEPLVELRGSL